MTVCVSLPNAKLGRSRSFVESVAEPEHALLSANFAPLRQEMASSSPLRSALANLRKCCFDKNELLCRFIDADIGSDYRGRHRVPIHPLPRLRCADPDDQATRMTPADIEFGAVDLEIAPLTNLLIALAQRHACAGRCSLPRSGRHGAVCPIGVKANQLFFWSNP